MWLFRKFPSVDSIDVSAVLTHGYVLERLVKLDVFKLQCNTLDPL